jgi:hypothetical protein
MRDRAKPRSDVLWYPSASLAETQRKRNMRLEPSDPDIETIVTRIERKDLDLQPEFQRGEVWGKAKKQRLIDSILREWHIPPVHVIEIKESRRQEVLDGQQRLAAIRDFVRGEFPVDGSIEPLEAELSRLGGTYFRDLPDDWRRRFYQFTIRIFRIVDYLPEEPGELFFRLNQPTSLTAAEQRNAFFGPPRNNIKDLVNHLESSGLDKTFFGFSNSRMAYDDVLARVCLTVRRSTLAEKVTASDLVDLYRSDSPLPEEVLAQVRAAISLVGRARVHLTAYMQLNKATVYSWFMFVIRAQRGLVGDLSPELLGAFLSWFEEQRAYVGLDAELEPDSVLTEELLRIYGDRSASRVADVSSVVLRDAIIWLGYLDFLQSKGVQGDSGVVGPNIGRLRAAIESAALPYEDDDLARVLIDEKWGVLP